MHVVAAVVLRLCCGCVGVVGADACGGCGVLPLEDHELHVHEGVDHWLDLVHGLPMAARKARQ